MRTINIPLMDHEYKKIVKHKNNAESWRCYLLKLVNNYKDLKK